MRKRLVFRVDDIGYTEAYDLGAFKVLETGVGSSADVMLDSMHTKEALEKLKDMPWLSIGWHRHLWERPVLKASEVPSLVDKEGRFKWRHRKRELMKEATYEDAYKEFEAELALCFSILHKYPDVASIDETSDLPLEKAFCDVIKKYGIAYNIFSSAKDHRHQKQCAPQYQHLKYYSSGVATNSSYKLEDFKDYHPLEKMMSLNWEEEEIFMYGWHPGYCDDYILEESTCNIHRCKELQAALSQEFKKWIIENQIELVNQKDVLNGTSEFQDHLKEINSPLWIGNFKV